MMRWLNPESLWAEVMAGLILLVWIRGEWCDRNRLRTFLHPEIMGLHASWPARLGSLSLLLFGVAAAAAIPSMPVFPTDGPAPGVPVIQMVLDRASMEGGSDRLWDGLDAAVQALSDDSRDLRFSFALAGSPAQTFIYPTSDARGLQIMVSRLRFDTRPVSKWDGSQPLEDVSAGGQVAQLAWRVIFTAVATDELERMAASRELRDALWVHLPGDGTMPQFGLRNPVGQWTWTTDLTPLRLRWTSAPQGGDAAPAGQISPTQWLALAALLFLCGEAVCAQAARRRMKRSPFA
jgi:hypothetical protein